MESQRQRIVGIDDNENDLQVTKRLLDRRGYDAIPAQSGEEGLRLAYQLLPDAIIVDYRMPGMNGFEVTRRIKADTQLQTIPVLMLTGSDSAEHVVEGLGAGAEDFVTKGSDIEIVVARLRRMNHQMTRDLQIARRVQEALVPERVFTSPRIEIRSAYIPSEVLSGDFYDYFTVDDFTYLFVADVSGHGLPSAILVSLLKSYIHTEAANDRPLSDFMARLNDFLFSVSLPTQFATAAVFRTNGNRELVYSNAAHPPFLVYQREQRKTILLEQPSNLLGAMPHMTFEESTMHVAPGDTLFVYTDGLTDRVNGNREFYSIDRIARVMETSGDSDLTTVYDAIL